MPFRSMNLEEVAMYLSLSQHDVERRVRAGEIPCHQRGGRPVFLRSEIDEWASREILGMGENTLKAYHKAGSREGRSGLPEEPIMPGLIRLEYIQPEMDATTRSSAIDAAVDLAAATGKVYDPDELLESVHAREDLCSTAMPGGMALLHCRFQQAFRFEESFIVLGRTSRDIPFSAPDGRGTRFFFLLCLQDETQHLHTLARICLMATTTDMFLRLWNARNAEQMLQAIYDSEIAALQGRRHLKVIEGTPAGDEDIAPEGGA